MSKNYLILVWLALMVLFLQMRPMYTTEYICGKREKRVTFGYALLVFLPVIIWAGFRGNIADSLLSS